MRTARFAGLLLALPLLLAGCATVDLGGKGKPPAAPTGGKAPPGKGPGAYYMDDGPPEVVPPGLLDTPDPVPKIEPIARGPSKPYTVFDQTYVPITDNRPFVQRGVGSWYGRKFHGQRTASGEPYDMFKMTAAHPTLPIPSYARVTNLRNGKQVIVRVNDRGPFHSDRIIDLSYTAALKLGYLAGGSTPLEVERITPEAIARMNAAPEAAAAKPAAIAEAVPSPDPIAQVSMPGPASSAAPVAPVAGGYYLQFGAYAQPANAQAMRERLLVGWPRHLPPPAVVEKQGTYRLHSGPFANREEAGAAARALRAATQIPTVVVRQ